MTTKIKAAITTIFTVCFAIYGVYSLLDDLAGYYIDNAMQQIQSTGQQQLDRIDDLEPGEVSDDMEKWIERGSEHHRRNRDDIPLLIEHVSKPGGSKIQEFVNYAYLKLGDHDKGMKLAATIQCECDTWRPICTGLDGEMGVGQFHPNSHEPFRQSIEFHDVFNQIDYMVDVWIKREEQKLNDYTKRNPFYGYYDIDSRGCLDQFKLTESGKQYLDYYSP